MIIIPSKKFIFLRVPKTASTSLSHFLGERLVHISDMRHVSVPHANFITPQSIPLQPHINIDEMVKIELLGLDNVQQYRVFGVIRDPIERFLSCTCALHTEIIKTSSKSKFKYISQLDEKCSLEDLVDAMLNFTAFDPNYNIFRKQTDWLVFKDRPITDIFTYENINGLTSEVFKYCDVNCNDTLNYFYKVNRRIYKRENISLELRKRIIDTYKEDYFLYSKISGRVPAYTV